VMKKTIFFSLIFLQSLILPQTNFIEQITNGDFDARNPFIYKDEYAFNPPPIFFELHNNGFSNIYSIKYNSDTKKFEDTIALTSGNYLNINPSFESNSGLLYQTNQNGNWDIVLIPDSNGIFGDPIFLASSLNDEFSPKFFESTNMFQDSVNILFKRQTEIVFLTDKNNQIKENIVFKDSTDYHYTEFVGLETGDWGIFGGHYVFAVEESNLFQKRIVRRFKPFNGNWQPQTIVKDSCDCSDISLQVSGYNIWGLFYQDTVQTNKRQFIIEDPVSITSPQLVNIEYEGNISSFDMYSLLIVGKKFNKQLFDFDHYMPYTFLAENNGVTKVRIDLSDFGIWNTDSLVQVAVSKPNLAVGPVGLDKIGMVVYTIWEDSIDGHIQLFGIPRHLGYGVVENESFAKDFVLYQNYPNPFNPNTTIEYKILKGSEIRFNVINILGEKVFEKNFGYQSAGNYKIDFSATGGSANGGNAYNLPSGVYIYSIITDENKLSRKMLLLK
ncbi:MAG TPA: T9SS type A sorting domain-containing protein, partial [Ignavibacteriaceae bacterium]|nr:T9SS type A sorting domain-containing protein [Ignavibacteriaceae bacterium]